MYNIEKGKSFYSSLRSLHYTFCIPKNKEHLTLFRIVFFGIRFLSILSFIISPSIHLFITIRENTGINVSEHFSTIFGSLGCIVPAIMLLIYYEDWRNFFTDLEDFKKHGTHANFQAVKNKLNLYSLVYALYATGGVIVYAIIAATETSYCERFNEEHGLNEMCGTFSPLYLPFDGNPVYIRVPIFCLQAVLAYFTFTTAAVICFLPYEGVETIGSHIKLLKENIVEAFNATSETEKRNRFRFCVYYHIEILSLCQRQSQLGKYTSGFLCMTCAVVLGCIGNLVIKAKPLAGAIYLGGYMTALALLCHGGQQVMDETLSIADALYNSNWYEADVALRKDMLFMMAKCQRPVVLQALPLGSMDYPLFVMILKTSYTYLALLMQNT